MNFKLILSTAKMCAEKVQITENALRYTLFKQKQGVAVGYTCSPGFRFDSGGASRSAVCVNGSWIPMPRTCKGWFILYDGCVTQSLTTWWSESLSFSVNLCLWI